MFWRIDARIREQSFVRKNLAPRRCLSAITGIEKTLAFAPRFKRHIIGLPKIEGMSARTPFIVGQAVSTGLPEILATGCYHDTLASTANRIRFAARNAVYDNALIPNSLLYPL